MSAEFDLSELTKFTEKLNSAANGELQKELAIYIQGLGAEFLKIVEDEIISRKVMDTRLLLASFHQGGDNNIFEISDGGLTLEVGTNVEYAAYVNDGHWLNPQGVERRFVPGYWSGSRFIYDKSAKTGMMLKQKWVEGSHYWERAVAILEKFAPYFIENKIQEWLNKYFE